jgi:hypothetical protein
MTVEHWSTAAVDYCVRDNAVDQMLVLGANVSLVDALAEVSFARTESSTDCVGAGFFDMLYHLRTESIMGCPSVVA